MGMVLARQVVWLAVAGLKPHTPEHVELWLELCGRLERVVQDPLYADILASGDGVPDEHEL